MISTYLVYVFMYVVLEGLELFTVQVPENASHSMASVHVFRVDVLGLVTMLAQRLEVQNIRYRADASMKFD